jgi:hypothetical protein
MLSTEREEPKNQLPKQKQKDNNKTNMIMYSFQYIDKTQSSRAVSSPRSGNRTTQQCQLLKSALLSSFLEAEGHGVG